MGICVCMYRLLAMCIYNVIFARKHDGPSASSEDTR